MFEKEAKEWVKAHTETEYKASYGEFSIEPSAKKSFTAGAEYGYNKANEWHFVKDGDLPKEYDTVFVCTEFEKHKSCLICNYHYKKWWYADGKFDEGVIAWKEIVLPELKEIE